jgi:hypothetical protein
MATEPTMPTFQLFIHDKRFTVPTLVFVEAATEGRARARATEMLLQSPNHEIVDVIRDGDILFKVKHPARTDVPPSSQQSAPA